MRSLDVAWEALCKAHVDRRAHTIHHKSGAVTFGGEAHYATTRARKVKTQDHTAQLALLPVGPQEPKIQSPAIRAAQAAEKVVKERQARTPTKATIQTADPKPLAAGKPRKAPVEGKPAPAKPAKPPEPKAEARPKAPKAKPVPTADHTAKPPERKITGHLDSLKRLAEGKITDEDRELGRRSGNQTDKQIAEDAARDLQLTRQRYGFNPDTGEIREEFKVPVQNLATFREKVEDLNKRAAKLNQPKIELEISDRPTETRKVKFSVETGEWAPPGGLHPGGPITREIERMVSFHTVKIRGTAPGIAGWKVVAVLDHMQGGEGTVNVVRSLSKEDLPKAIRNRPNDCDHCKKTRARTTTVVLKKGEEYKQVGKQCLKDFTGHDQPEAIAAFAEDLQTYIAALPFLEDPDSGMWSGERQGRGHFHSVDDVLAHASRDMEERGKYVKAEFETDKNPSTRTAVEMGLAAQYRGEKGGKPDDRHYDQAAKVKAWMEPLLDKGTSEYERNLGAIAKMGYVTPKHMGFAASAVTAYRRASGQVEQKAKAKAGVTSNEYIGTKGERLKKPIEVTLKRVVTTEGIYGTSYGHFMEDAAGNQLTWWSSNPNEYPEGSKLDIVGSVKDHRSRFDRFLGMDRKSTILTRVTVHSADTGQTAPKLTRNYGREFEFYDKAGKVKEKLGEQEIFNRLVSKRGEASLQNNGLWFGRDDGARLTTDLANRMASEYARISGHFDARRVDPGADHPIRQREYEFEQLDYKGDPSPHAPPRVMSVAKMHDYIQHKIGMQRLIELDIDREPKTAKEADAIAEAYAGVGGDFMGKIRLKGIKKAMGIDWFRALQGAALEKSHIRQFSRRTKSGKIAIVAAHYDKRTKRKDDVLAREAESHRNLHMEDLKSIAQEYMDKMRAKLPEGTRLELGGSLQSNAALKGHNDIDLRVMLPEGHDDEAGIRAASAAIADIVPYQKVRPVGTPGVNEQSGVIHQVNFHRPGIDGEIEVEVSVRPAKGYLGLAKFENSLPHRILDQLVVFKRQTRDESIASGDKSRYKGVKGQLHEMTDWLHGHGYWDKDGKVQGGAKLIQEATRKFWGDSVEEVLGKASRLGKAIAGLEWLKAHIDRKAHTIRSKSGKVSFGGEAHFDDARQRQQASRPRQQSKAELDAHRPYADSDPELVGAIKAANAAQTVLRRFADEPGNPVYKAAQKKLGLAQQLIRKHAGGGSAAPSPAEKEQLGPIKGAGRKRKPPEDGGATGRKRKGPPPDAPKPAAKTRRQASRDLAQQAMQPRQVVSPEARKGKVETKKAKELATHQAGLKEREREHAAKLQQQQAEHGAELKRREREHQAALTKQQAEHQAGLAKQAEEHKARLGKEAAVHQAQLGGIADERKGRISRTNAEHKAQQEKQPSLLDAKTKAAAEAPRELAGKREAQAKLQRRAFINQPAKPGDARLPDGGLFGPQGQMKIGDEKPPIPSVKDAADQAKKRPRAVPLKRQIADMDKRIANTKKETGKDPVHLYESRRLLQKELEAKNAPKQPKVKAPKPEPKPKREGPKQDHELTAHQWGDQYNRAYAAKNNLNVKDIEKYYPPLSRARMHRKVLDDAAAAGKEIPKNVIDDMHKRNPDEAREFVNEHMLRNPKAIPEGYLLPDVRKQNEDWEAEKRQARKGQGSNPPAAQDGSSGFQIGNEDEHMAADKELSDRLEGHRKAFNRMMKHGKQNTDEGDAKFDKAKAEYDKHDARIGVLKAAIDKYRGVK